MSTQLLYYFPSTIRTFIPMQYNTSTGQWSGYQNGFSTDRSYHGAAVIYGNNFPKC